MVEFEPLGPLFGARVHGCDLAHLDDEAFATIRSGLVRHEVLVFDDQPIETADHVALGRRFGELSVSPFSPSADEVPELIVLDNHGDSPRPADRHLAQRRDVPHRAADGHHPAGQDRAGPWRRHDVCQHDGRLRTASASG